VILILEGAAGYSTKLLVTLFTSETTAAADAGDETSGSLQGFRFEDRKALADRFNIQADAQENIRAQLAWKHICGLLRPERRRASAVHYYGIEDVPMAQCIIIRTNK